MRRLFTLFIAVISAATLVSCAASKYDKNRAFKAAAEAAGRIGSSSDEYYYYVFGPLVKTNSTTVEGEMKRSGIDLDNFISTQGYDIEKFIIILSVSRTKARLEVIIDDFDFYCLLVSDSTYPISYDPATGSMDLQVYDADPETEAIVGNTAVTVRSNPGYSLSNGTALTITDSSKFGNFTENTPFLLTGVPASSQAANTQSID